MEESYLHGKYAAAYCGISDQRFRELRALGRGPEPSHRHGCGRGRAFQYTREELDRWMASRRRPATETAAAA